MVSSSQVTACKRIRSTTPRKSSPSPNGIWTGSGTELKRSFICPIVPGKFAPTRSILLMKATLGTPYLSAWCQTVSDWGSTPPTAQNTTTAPSRTRRQRSTSIVKSTWPGVSMMWISWFRQAHVVTAEVMVIPRSCSCGIQSITASPS